MKILTLRTDSPEAEVGIYNDFLNRSYEKWFAHKELSSTLLGRIDSVIKSAGMNTKDINAIIVFVGPGSFTGLRIGISVANGLAYSLGVPIVGTNGDAWIEKGIKLLKNNLTASTIVPEYGAPVHITTPKK